jgi:hypothetical protein
MLIRLLVPMFFSSFASTSPRPPSSHTATPRAAQKTRPEPPKKDPGIRSMPRCPNGR